MYKNSMRDFQCKPHYYVTEIHILVQGEDSKNVGKYVILTNTFNASMSPESAEWYHNWIICKLQENKNDFKRRYGCKWILIYE